MRRALATARPLAQSCPAGTVCCCWPQLLHEEGGLFGGQRSERGIGHPDVHGISASQVREALPSIEVADDAFPFGGDGGGGGGGGGGGWWKGGCETNEEAAARARATADMLWQLAEEHAEAGRAAGDAPACVLVTHGLFFDRLLKTLLGCGGGGEIFFQVANCSLTVLDFVINDDEAAAAPAADSAAAAAAATAAPGQPRLHRRAVHLSGLNVLGHLPAELHTKTSLNGHRPPALSKLFTPCAAELRKLVGGDDESDPPAAPVDAADEEAERIQAEEAAAQRAKQRETFVARFGEGQLEACEQALVSADDGDSVLNKGERFEALQILGGIFQQAKFVPLAVEHMQKLLNPGNAATDGAAGGMLPAHPQHGPVAVNAAAMAHEGQADVHVGEALRQHFLAHSPEDARHTAAVLKHFEGRHDALRKMIAQDPDGRGIVAAARALEQHALKRKAAEAVEQQQQQQQLQLDGDGATDIYELLDIFTIVENANDAAIKIQRTLRFLAARSSMKKAVEAVLESLAQMSALLVRGFEVLKFPRNGKAPEARVLWLQSDGTLCLDKVRSDQPSKRRVRLEDIDDIVIGAEHEVFQKSAKKAELVDGQENTLVTITSRGDGASSLHFSLSAEAAAAAFTEKLRSVKSRLAMCASDGERREQAQHYAMNGMNGPPV
jgi:broad specificity phosphatase PhoE